MLSLYTVEIAYDKNYHEIIICQENIYANSKEEAILLAENKYSKKGKIRWTTCILGLPKNELYIK
jgi:hypothetical protein